MTSKNIYLILTGRDENILPNKKSIKFIFEKCKSYRKRIKYLGILHKERIFYLYNNAEAIIIPSRLDNYPNVMIESIAFRKPVIGFYNSSLDEIIEDKKTGYLGRNQNSQNLSDKIDEFLCLSSKKRLILRKNIHSLI